MFISLLSRAVKVVNINTPANNVNLFTSAGSPTYPLNVICSITANVSSSNVYVPAFRTGASWATGSFVYIRNRSNIVGAAGNTTYGTPGNGGNGGAGAQTGTTGNTGSTGTTGSSGYVGGPGGIALYADTKPAGVTMIFDNTNGSIIAGYSGVASGGLGGGGGGGGGGS